MGSVYHSILSAVAAEKSWQRLLVRVLSCSFDTRCFPLQAIGFTLEYRLLKEEIVVPNHSSCPLVLTA